MHISVPLSVAHTRGRVHQMQARQLVGAERQRSLVVFQTFTKAAIKTTVRHTPFNFLEHSVNKKCNQAHNIKNIVSIPTKKLHTAWINTFQGLKNWGLSYRASYATSAECDAIVMFIPGLSPFNQRYRLWEDTHAGMWRPCEGHIERLWKGTQRVLAPSVPFNNHVTLAHPLQMWFLPPKMYYCRDAAAFRRAFKSSSIRKDLTLTTWTEANCVQLPWLQRGWRQLLAPTRLVSWNDLIILKPKIHCGYIKAE